MKKHLNLIWDLDGTLVDSESEVLEKLNIALKEVGIDKSKQKASFRIGPPLAQMIEEALDINKEETEAVIKSFRNHYDNSDFSKTIPFPYINEILSDNSFNHYVITNKANLAAKKIISSCGWDNYIKKLVTPDCFQGQTKTKLEMFHRLVNSEKIDITIAYGIGDMKKDEDCAKQLGIKTIGVLWGVGTSEELCNCDYLCKTGYELYSLLKKINDNI